MKLYFTPTSPFSRKVMVLAHEVGVASRIETIFLRPLPMKADAELTRSNPLSKIPVLITDEGESLYDSSVICEYIDSIHQGPPRIPRAGNERWRALKLQALADGILDAAVLVFYERTQRPKELHWDAWIAGQTEKANLGLDALDREATRFGEEFGLGEISAAAAIGWLEFRNVLGDIRTNRPTVSAWYEKQKQRPSLVATTPRA